MQIGTAANYLPIFVIKINPIKNIQLYPFYKAGNASMAWLAVFFLFFSEKLALNEVLLLESIYYIAVVILEVPSGYFSDRLGRKVTLVIASLAFTLAYIQFFFAVSFLAFIVAQVLLALGMSFQSGTDTVFHYESLKENQLDLEYGEREAKVQKWTQFAGGVAALLGGILGMYALNLPYLLSFCGAFIALIIAIQFKEPKSHDKVESLLSDDFRKQLISVFSNLNTPILKWLFIYSVLLYALTHIPYEFYQPYLSLLEKNNQLWVLNASLTSGIIYGITRMIGAWSAGESIRLKRKIGLKNILILSLVLQIVTIGLLGFWLHPLLIICVVFRNLSFGLTTAPILEEVTPRIGAELRATYLSIQSLFNRMAFFITLLLLSTYIGESTTDWFHLSSLLKVSFYGALIVSGIVYALSYRKFRH